jgi:hypothetical protein
MSGADLRNELAEAASVREVDAGAGLAAVTIAPGNARPLLRAGQFNRVGILLPAASTVQFERVKLGATLAQQALEGERMVFFGNAFFEPERVIRGDQDVGNPRELTPGWQAMYLREALRCTPP